MSFLVSPYNLCHTLLTIVLALLCPGDVYKMNVGEAWLRQGKPFLLVSSSICAHQHMTRIQAQSEHLCSSKTRFIECFCVPGTCIHIFISSLQPSSGGRYLFIRLHMYLFMAYYVPGAPSGIPAGPVYNVSGNSTPVFWGEPSLSPSQSKCLRLWS